MNVFSAGSWNALTALSIAQLVKELTSSESLILLDLKSSRFLIISDFLCIFGRVLIY